MLAQESRGNRSSELMQMEDDEGGFEDNYRARYIDDQITTQQSLHISENANARRMFENSGLIISEPDTNS